MTNMDKYTNQISKHENAVLLEGELMNEAKYTFTFNDPKVMDFVVNSNDIRKRGVKIGSYSSKDFHAILTTQVPFDKAFDILSRYIPDKFDNDWGLDKKVRKEELQTEANDNLQYNIKATRALGEVRKDLDVLSKNEFMKAFGDMKTLEKHLKAVKKTVNAAYDKALDAWDKTKNN